MNHILFSLTTYVTQRGDLLDFTDQNHYKSEMEENQNPEHRAEIPVKIEEPDSPSAATDSQVSVLNVRIKLAS